jgi:hypothetical protein
LRLHFPPLVFVAVLDGCTVRTSWELLILLPDARGLSGTSGMRWQSNTRPCKLSSPQLLNLVSRLVVHEGLVVRQDEGCDVLFCLTNKTHKFNLEPRNRKNSSIYIHSYCLLHLSVFLPYYINRQHPDLNIRWLAQNNASRSKSHPITYTTLYAHCRLPLNMFNCIRMLTPPM